MTAAFHPRDDLLMAYGAGSLDEASALLIATHLALCPRCRAAVAAVEELGGVILDQTVPAVMSDGALSAVLARLDEPTPPSPATRPRRAASTPSGPFPQPLRDYLGAEPEALSWRRLARGVHQVMVLEGQSAKARLLRIAPGLCLPDHGHGGNEMTLVLSGGFSDHDGPYHRGDVASAEPGIVHRPVAASGGDCLCLVVTDAPLKLTGLLGRLVSPFLTW